MFGFLTNFLGRSLSTNIVELLFQLILFYTIYKLGSTKSKLWCIISKRLSAFLILETFVQFAVKINKFYLLFTIPLLIKLGFIFIIVWPLIKLWLELPNLLFEHRNESKESIIVDKANKLIEYKPLIDLQVNERLKRSLSKINRFVYREH